MAVTGWTAPPFTPSGLSATGGDTQVALNWSSSAGATGYNLRRSSVSGGPYTLIANNLGATTCTDIGRTNGTTYYYVVSSLGTGGESTDSAEVAGTAMNAQQAWRYAKFGTIANSGNAADSADPDEDGRSNLLEYGTGSEPLTADSGSAQTVGKSGDGTRLTLTFNRIADPALTYTVEAGNDLSPGSWSSIGWSSTGAANVAGGVTVTDTELIANYPKRFLRLRVTY